MMWTIQDSPRPPPLLVLGLSRTGGTSLATALGLLGYQRLYDLDDVAHGGPEHADFWLQAVQKKLSGKEEFSYDFDQLLHGYDGVRNIPFAAFAAELIAHYPSSKVILPTRDVDSWHISCLTTVYQRSRDPILQFLALFDTNSRVYANLLRGLQQILYKGDFPNYGKTAFYEHNEYIRRNVKPGNLLEYNVEQGWEPLCDFLEKEVPMCAFPRNNDRNIFWQGCRKRDKRVAKKVLIRALPLCSMLLIGLVSWLLLGAGDPIDRVK
ncbi:hypothetical protein DTO217A2_2053 [Paecilomyces variotii]|nr:hypothetical protein DTO217A2_2053 [Paecilomyces variotii]KAJ9320843.1 hypothetical protein DTO027B3_8155 [Paecilomyces variotii]KAJ9369863.1 hypothetical protein DTO282E5_5371 [Paecilomyces variotii]